MISGYFLARDLNRKAPDFDGATGWINSPPVHAASLHGKVILVDFWTLSCINCIRTFPYLKAWDEKYRDKGLVIIGVHTPEFAFEQSSERVQEAVTTFGLRYPIALDNNRALWDGFANHWWPHKYLLDDTGRIRNEFIGEGDYDRVEQTIQRLLAERHGGPPAREITPVVAETTDPKKIGTPEIYFGTSFVPDGGTFALGNQPAGSIENQTVSYLLPEAAAMAPNQFYLDGKWAIRAEKAEFMGEGQGRVLLSYEARAVNVVSEHPDRPALVYVLYDGKPLTRSQAGPDVKFDAGGRSYVTVTSGRMYRLINDADYGRHQLELQTAEKGFAVYTLTFG